METALHQGSVFSSKFTLGIRVGTLPLEEDKAGSQDGAEMGRELTPSPREGGAQPPSQGTAVSCRTFKITCPCTANSRA